jgi:hypothetical protein
VEEKYKSAAAVVECLRMSESFMVGGGLELQLDGNMG